MPRRHISYDEHSPNPRLFRGVGGGDTEDIQAAAGDAIPPESQPTIQAQQHYPENQLGLVDPYDTTSTASRFEEGVGDSSGGVDDNIVDDVLSPDHISPNVSLRAPVHTTECHESSASLPLDDSDFQNTPLRSGQAPPVFLTAEAFAHESPNSNVQFSSSEEPFLPGSSSTSSQASSAPSVELEEFETTVSHQEVRDLGCSSYMATFCATGRESGASLCEDLDSRIYYDFDDESYSDGPWEDVQEEDNLSLRATVTPEEIEARAQAQRTGGWTPGSTTIRLERSLSSWMT